VRTQFDKAGGRHSLRGKITWAYVAVAAVMLLASLFFVGELRTLEARVELGQRVTELFDTVLEIRRYERNYFLHRQPADLAENARQIALARSLLTTHRTAFLAVAAPVRLDTLQARLDDYGRQMAAYAGAAPGQFEAIEPRVRALGKDVVALAEDMAGSERRQIRTTLAAFRNLLLGVILCMALLIVVIGRALSQRVAKPLKEMEASVAAITANRRETLATPSNDREIVSIIEAFNHMLQELDLRQKSLMRSERLASLGTMLSGVAHELNNPLSNISTSCQILLEETDACDPATLKKYLSQIDRQTERARTIVRSLLDFSREKAFRKAPVRLKPLVEQTVGFVRGEVSAKSLVQLSIADDLSVPADAQRLQQVLVNLIRNAMEGLGPDGRIRIAAERLRPSAPPPGTALGSGCGATAGMVEIRVEDNGPGIAPDVLPRVFDPFFTTKDVGHGMGLGLFVAYEIVDEHGGCIAAESAPGQGACFRIRLPLEATDQDDKGVQP
jgi:signal transduction histidine kinase